MPKSLGGSQTATTTVPAWLETAGQDLLARSNEVSRIGYVPYTGPQVAAFTPMQNDAFRGTNQMASAFGMPTSRGNGMPAPRTFANGMQGYSSMPLYNQAMRRFENGRPGQFNAIAGMFIDPTTGQLQAAPQQQPQPQQQQQGPTQNGGGVGPQQQSGGGSNTGGNSYTSSGQLRPEARPTGFTSLGDMFNGGGPGASAQGYTGLRDMVNGGGPGAGGGLLSNLFRGR